MSTTADILAKVKEFILREKDDSLNGVKTYQSGPIGTNAIFPVLAIVPVSENFEYRYNNQYVNTRRFVVEVYDRGVRPKRSLDNTIKYVHALREIFEDNFKWDGLVFDSRWINDEYGINIPLSSSMMHMSSIELEVKSRELLPDRVIPATIDNNVSPKILADRMTKLLKENASTYDYQRYGMNFYNNITGTVPSHHLPAGVVVTESKFRLFNRPRANDPTVGGQVHILSNLIAKETNLNFNLAMTDKIVDLLQARYTFDNGSGVGFAESSRINSITYDLAKEEMIYNTVIDMDINLREYVDQE